MKSLAFLIALSVSPLCLAAEPDIYLAGMSSYDGDPSETYAGRVATVTLQNYDACSNYTVTTWTGILDSTSGVLYLDTSVVGTVDVTNRNMFTIAIQGSTAGSGWNECDFQVVQPDGCTCAVLIGFMPVAPMTWIWWAPSPRQPTTSPPAPAVVRCPNSIDPSYIGWTPPPPPPVMPDVSPFAPVRAPWTTP